MDGNIESVGDSVLPCGLTTIAEEVGPPLASYALRRSWFRCFDMNLKRKLTALTATENSFCRAQFGWQHSGRFDRELMAQAKIKASKHYYPGLPRYTWMSVRYEVGIPKV